MMKHKGGEHHKTLLLIVGEEEEGVEVDSEDHWPDHQWLVTLFPENRAQVYGESEGNTRSGCIVWGPAAIKAEGESPSSKSIVQWSGAVGHALGRGTAGVAWWEGGAGIAVAKEGGWGERQACSLTLSAQACTQQAQIQVSWVSLKFVPFGRPHFKKKNTKL